MQPENPKFRISNRDFEKASLWIFLKIIFSLSWKTQSITIFSRSMCTFYFFDWTANAENLFIRPLLSERRILTICLYGTLYIYMCKCVNEEICHKLCVL